MNHLNDSCYLELERYIGCFTFPCIFHTRELFEKQGKLGSSLLFVIHLPFLLQKYLFLEIGQYFLENVFGKKQVLERKSLINVALFRLRPYGSYGAGGYAGGIGIGEINWRMFGYVVLAFSIMMIFYVCICCYNSCQGDINRGYRRQRDATTINPSGNAQPSSSKKNTNRSVRFARPVEV